MSSRDLPARSNIPRRFEFLIGRTPLECYRVRGKDVWVKRDDLFARWPAPPLGKLRGAPLILAELYAGGVRLVGCWDTRVSALGQGIAACAMEFPGLRVVTAYPASLGSSIPEPLCIARQLGAEVLPVRAGRITISFSSARKAVVERGGVMLPFGLECPESVEAVSLEASSLPAELVAGGTLIVCCGSGVTLAGLIRGLGSLPAAYIGVSSGRSVTNIERCLRRHGASLDRVRLFAAETEYNRHSDIFLPFPSHPNYDQKAWAYLEKNIEHLRPPVLFWNVGAAGTGMPTNQILKERAETNGRDGLPPNANASSTPRLSIGVKRDSLTTP